MPAPALSAPAAPEALTIFSELRRGRLPRRPWVEFIFDQSDLQYAEDGTTPLMNSVGQPWFIGRGQVTRLHTSDPAKLADLEARAHAYHLAGRLPDETDATIAYEELEACREAGSQEAIQALGYEVYGNFLPWP